MGKLAYDYTHAELVDAFTEAVAKSGISNSGLVISVFAGYDAAEAFYLKGVLLSRLEGAERPFTRGDHVKISGSASRQATVLSQNTSGEYYSFGRAEPGKTYEVFRVFYESNGKWSLSFGGEEGYRYPAERFEKAAEDADKPTTV